jgi:LysM repeat protein
VEDFIDAKHCTNLGMICKLVAKSENKIDFRLETPRNTYIIKPKFMKASVTLSRDPVMMVSPASLQNRWTGSRVISVCVGLCLLLLQGCMRPVSQPFYWPPPAQSHTEYPASQPPSSQGAEVTNTGRGATTVRVVEKCLINTGQTKTFIHEVGPLETVWRLSRMYDVPQQDIYAANRMKTEDPLRIGQKLVIPNAKSLRHVIPLYPSNQWKYIIIHHTATDIGNAMLVHRSHHDRGFWQGLGYHFIIDNGTLSKCDGQIEVAPRWIKQQEGAHCKAGGMNGKAIGVALVGNFNETLPTTKQMESLAYLLRTLMQQYRIPPSQVMGHRDVDGASTDCPGKRFPWSNLRQCLSTY